MESEKKPVMKGKPKRKPNPYALYIKENWNKVEGKAPERMKKIAEMWKNK